MTDTSQLPLTLYKANLELWLRIGQLLEDNREQWTELLSRELQDGLAGARADAEKLQADQDWPAMAMLPGSTLWRIAEQQVGDMQALAQTASSNQMTFVNGFQQALAEWQEATAGALGDVSADAGLPERMFEGLRETLDNLPEALLPTAAAAPGAAAAAALRTVRPSADATARKPAKRTAAAKRPAGKRPAKKAAARKAAQAKKAVGKATKKAAKKAAVKKAAGKRAGVKKAARRKAASKKTASKKTAPKKAAPRKAARKTVR